MSLQIETYQKAMEKALYIVENSGKFGLEKVIQQLQEEMKNATKTSSK